MIPISISIEGIGPYRELAHINLSDLKSPVAICAQYGTGKTFLIESILVALYSGGAWYSDTYELLTQGGTGEGKIELEFSHKGQTYQARRELKDTGKTRTQKAMLFQGKDLVAGPKVSDFDRAIGAMMGDRETFLATAFLSQNRSNDLVGEPGVKDLVALRRQVFGNMIGADVLDAIAERAAKEAIAEQAILETLESQLAGQPDYSNLISGEQVKLQETGRTLALAKTQLEKAERDLEKVRCQLRDAEGGDDVLLAQIRQHEDAVKAEESLRRRIVDLRNEFGSLCSRADGLEKAKDDVTELNRLISLRGELRLKLEKFDDSQKWKEELHRLNQAAIYAHDKVTSLEAVPGVDEATRILASGIGAARIDYQNANAQNVERQSTNLENGRLRESFKSEINHIEQLLSSHHSRIAAKPQTPGGTVCEACPLLKEYRDIPRLIEQDEKALASIKERLAAIAPDQELTDLTPLIKHGQDCANAAKAVEAAKESAANLEAARQALSTAEFNLNAHLEDKPEEVADPRPELKNVQTAIDNRSGAPERVKACEQARLDSIAKKAALEKEEANLAETTKSKDALFEAAQSAKAALADKEKQREELVQEERRASMCVAGYKQEEGVQAHLVTRYETRIEEYQRQSAEHAEKREEAAARRDDLEGLKDLRQVFGPRGVRQILIDNAAPELEGIADDLFDRATGGRQRLSIQTQKVLGDGGIAEDFSIIVQDERGARDALRYSGGQLQLIRILFRIAFALCSARLHGQKPESLFLDEAFDRLGAEGSEDLLRVLEYLQDSIGLIIVVTHEGLIADRLRSQVRLTKQFGGVLIETRGAKN